MELLRKYSAMFIPVGLVLVAVVLIVATILMGGSLKEQMATSVGHHNTIRTLLNSAVSQRQAEVERDYQDEHQRDAEAFAELTARSSQRPLLAYNMFPAPDAGETSDTIFHNFARAYSAAIDDLVKRMRGGVPHSAAEMAMATRAATAAGATGTAATAAMTGTEIQRLTDMLARQRAQTMQVYADPHAFAGYDYGRMLVLTDRTQSIVECWYWQVAYWIQEDIAETIIAMNAEARNVLEAPVKRLLGISFSTPNSLALARAGRAAMPGAPMGAPVISAPAHVGMDGTAAIALNPEWPQYVTTASTAFVSPTPTNRITNEDIDVIHFSFAVILRASSLMPFMSELSSEKTHTFRGFDGMGQPQEGLRNQITILGYTALPVDITADEALFFRYGDDALYRVNFICEYIFDRRGYDVIKPEAVKAQPAAVQGVSFEE